MPPSIGNRTWVFQNQNERSQRRNPDGSVSTELSITVKDPRTGGWMNIPSMYGGKEVSEDEAIKRVQDAGYKDPETGRAIESFGSLKDAENAARTRSNALTEKVWGMMNPTENMGGYFENVLPMFRQVLGEGRRALGAKLSPLMLMIDEHRGKGVFDPEYAKADAIDTEQFPASEYMRLLVAPHEADVMPSNERGGVLENLTRKRMTEKVAARLQGQLTGGARAGQFPPALSDFLTYPGMYDPAYSAPDHDSPTNLGNIPFDHRGFADEYIKPAFMDLLMRFYPNMR